MCKVDVKEWPISDVQWLTKVGAGGEGVLPNTEKFQEKHTIFLEHPYLMILACYLSQMEVHTD